MGALTSRQHAGVEEVDIPSNSVYRYPPKSGEGRARAAGPGGGEGERHGGGPGGPRVGLGAGQVAGGGEGCRAGRCPPSRTPTSPRGGLQVPAGSSRSRSCEDGLGGPLLCVKDACRMPGMRRCSDCGFGEASLTGRHLCQLSSPGCLILAAGTVRSGFLPVWGGGGTDTNLLLQSLAFSGGCQGENEVSRKCMVIGQSHLDCSFASCWSRDGWGQGKSVFQAHAFPRKGE